MKYRGFLQGLKLATCIAFVAAVLLPSAKSADTPAATTLASNAPVTLRDFKLTGDLKEDRATFVLTATAHVEGFKGGSLDVLSGAVALTELGAHPRWKVGVEQDRYVLKFDQRGDFQVQLKFEASVIQNGGWNRVDFRVAPSVLQPILLHGLAADTQFQFAGAARPDRTGTDFSSYLPSDGSVRLAWKEAKKEEEGKLFYAAEMLSQITLSPGQMRQVAFVDYKVMQGEVSKVTLSLGGEGEVTRVVGDHVLAWNVEPSTGFNDRKLVVQLNEPQKDLFAVRVEIQTPLGAFPQTAVPVRVLPEGATRFAGYFRIVNEGAVRLEVSQASGLSQISPEQFPIAENDNSRAGFRVTGSQRFAYRFSGKDFALKIQADQIFPELSASQVLAYRLGESELSIDTEIELDIREAPLRELLLHVPKGYVVARLSAGKELSDYFLREPADETNAELRLVYGQPVSGRQVIQLRLERNQALGGTNWALPGVEVLRAKSRGHVAVAADAGYRLTPERTVGLTDIATAFFPRRVAGIQAAFRFGEQAWGATLRVERLPQTVNADSFHLFSIGEGIAYGSSVMNYVVSGSPVSAFRVELSDEYSNVEFTGKDVRNWQKTTNGYVVQLHSPVAGPYTLLATYERVFKPKGDTLPFMGARPLDAEREQGHTLVISAYQFDVTQADVSPGLLALEPAEVPAQYRLFFDAPILKAYRYTSRPFNLRLALKPLAQGGSLSQVVDRASITNRISKEGQVLTDVRYYMKNRGNPHFEVMLPPNTDLWSATVNGVVVSPVKDGKAHLIPLPQRADPNAVLTVDLKLAAAPSGSAQRLTLTAPEVAAPVTFVEWKLEPDANRRLVFKKGSLTPAGGVPDVSGFAGLARTFGGAQAEPSRNLVLAMVVMVGIALVAWRWAGREGRYKFSARHLAGSLVGLGAFVVAVMALMNLVNLTERADRVLPRDLMFLAPVQGPHKALTLEVSNIADTVSAFDFAWEAWPAALGLLIWAYGWLSASRGMKMFGRLAGWTLLGWAALRCPNGAVAFLYIMLAFLLLNVALPALRQLWSMPREGESVPPRAQGGKAPAVAAIVLLLGLAGMGTGCMTMPAGQTGTNQVSAAFALPDLVTHTIRVEEKFALGTAKIHWEAEKGAVLPLLFEPAVMTKVKYPETALTLGQSAPGTRRARQLVAERSGSFDIEVEYQLQVAQVIVLPTQRGLVNQVKMTLVNLDVDVFSALAVSVQRTNSGSNTVATLSLAPLADAWIGWKPRTRDVRREKAVFYADIYQLYAPTAGVIEGAHYAAIRPAQGELSELIFDVPAGATITDVAEAAKPANAPALVSLWRFDPDTRKLRVNLQTAQSRPFALVIRSQVATGPLPFEKRVGLISVDNAASQNGFLGIATGNEVQLDNVDNGALSAINLEDFPGGWAQSLASQIPGLTVRRAFRYGESRGAATLKASAVEPDVRVETDTTLSLGEDRTVLAAKVTANITRAGIFRLSFVLPRGIEVETVSGAALSHWTEAKSNDDRVITLQLKGKTEGQQQFAISLSGQGLKATNGWAAPQLVLREASKQRGTLLIVPEQGMRLQATPRGGVTQLDPTRSGIRQKGVLAFQILQTPWDLSLDIEQVDPWVQVITLQHATVNEALVKVAENLQYQIENTGLKSFRVLLPTNAESVRFQGDQLLEFVKTGAAVTNGLEEWEVKLHRRVIGQYLLQLNYQYMVPGQATEVQLRGVQAEDVNQQRGFVTVQSAGRLRLQVDALPSSLQPAEYQSIPRMLQLGMQAAPANFCYRLVEQPAFSLPMKIQRHEAAKLLPARVQSITLTSVIADDGGMLTQARLEMLPGDKRLLEVELPKDAQFWFAFVNQNGVWPWKGTNYLIPLDGQSRDGKTVPVEIYYSRTNTGGTGTRSLDLQFDAPKFDLPLENITWRVYLNDKWQVKHWGGTMQLASEQLVSASAVDQQMYLQKEAGVQREKTREAEQMLALGNSALEKGEQEAARRAFQAAYGLSQGDNAFNEDARVQLNNLKLQQALVGLNVRQAAAAGEMGGFSGRLRELRDGKDLNYTQQDAKDIIDKNTSDENAAFMRVAERLVQQQDAAVSSPAVIRASIPEQGRVLTFRRSVVVNPMADLRIALDAAAARAATWGARVTILLATFAALAIVVWAARPFRNGKAKE